MSSSDICFHMEASFGCDTWFNMDPSCATIASSAQTTHALSTITAHHSILYEPKL